MAAQRSAAHPLTSPLGSNPSGTCHGSNDPSLVRRASRQRSITSATSSATTCVPPRRRREMTLSGRKVEKTESTRCNSARTAAHAASTAPSLAPGSRTSIETIVPHTCSTRVRTWPGRRVVVMPRDLLGSEPPSVIRRILTRCTRRRKHLRSERFAPPTPGLPAWGRLAVKYEHCACRSAAGRVP